MVLTAEKEPKLGEKVKEIPEVPEIPKEIEGAGQVRVTPTQVTQVEDRGKVLLEPPETKKIRVEIPADEGTLAKWAKGPPTEAIKGLGILGLRLLKKALHFGWQTIVAPLSNKN